MRKAALIFVLLLANVPAYAQSTSGASSSVNISNPASTDSRNRLTTVPTVVSPGLAAAGMETCLGAASGGLSLMGFGLTLGKTTPDEGCHIRLAARQLYAFGLHRAAVALMCQDSRVAEAMTAAGESCPGPIVETGARRRKRNAEDRTGPANQAPSADTGARRKQKFSESKPRSVVVPWKNPDEQPRAMTLAFWKAPQSALVQDASMSAMNADEENLFARMNTTY